MSEYKELLHRTKNGPFSRWCFESAPVAESDTSLDTVQLTPYAQGLESNAQVLVQYVADGENRAARQALQAVLRHAAALLDNLEGGTNMGHEILLVADRMRA